MSSTTEVTDAQIDHGLPPWQFFLLCGMLGATAVVIVVPDIVARVGTIRVQANYLVGGSGAVLESPGDARINVTNNSPYYLRVQNLTIPSDLGGQVTFNGTPVTGNADVNARNQYAPTGQTSTFGTFVTAQNSAPPSVTASTLTVRLVGISGRIAPLSSSASACVAAAGRRRGTSGVAISRSRSIWRADSAPCNRGRSPNLTSAAPSSFAARSSDPY